MKMTWHHPSYYRKLREERKKIPVSGTGEQETAPSGIKTEDLIDYKKFHQMMVTQLKAPSVKRPESQAASDKPQAPRHKPQASSRKRQAPSPVNPHKVSSHKQQGS